MFINDKINIIDIFDIKFIQYLRIIQSNQRPPSTNRRQSLSLFRAKSADRLRGGKMERSDHINHRLILSVGRYISPSLASL